MSLAIESEALSATINPRAGGTITGLRHRPSGLSVLGQVPWTTIEDPLPAPARDEPEWLTRYTGGWPLLFPNAGDACTVDGVFHGFHGEASVSPWDVTSATSDTLVLARRFNAVPVFMRREISIARDTLTIRETLKHHGDTAISVMWGHHPTFGSDLLDGPFEMTSGAAEMSIEPAFAPPASANLLRPSAPLASLAYLQRFAQSWAAIRRCDDAIAVLLTWDGARFPCAWLWHELEATAAAPWSGRTRLIAIEPNTTPCALGLAEAMARGAPLLRLAPGEEATANICLRVFKPEGPINSNLT
ncbi:hypothetical protein [Aestuariivirga sp.]|uniref:hypothetical protein n=1 Tax=Aestuariivirga sp. TaxID=2650926 RepID=UPI003782F5E9